MTYSKGVYPGRFTLPQQPFRVELGDRRRSTLQYFYIGVASSALAVVPAQKLPSFHSPLLAAAILGAGLAILFLVRYLRSNDEREQQINYRALTLRLPEPWFFLHWSASCKCLDFIPCPGLASLR